MMDIIAPDNSITEQEFSDAIGDRQRAILKGRKKYGRGKDARKLRREARRGARSIRKENRQNLRADRKAGKVSRDEAREIRKNWRQAGKVRFTTAVKDEFTRLKNTWDANKKKRQENRTALDAPKVDPIPPKTDKSQAELGTETQFVKKLSEVNPTTGQKSLPSGNTTIVDKKNQVEVPGPGGTIKIFDKEDIAGQPIKQNSAGDGAIMLGVQDVELVKDENGNEDFYHTADVSSDGWWKSLPTWGKAGVIIGALTIGVLGTWGVVKLVQKGKKGK